MGKEKPIKKLNLDSITGSADMAIEEILALPPSLQDSLRLGDTIPQLLEALFPGRKLGGPLEAHEIPRAIPIDNEIYGQLIEAFSRRLGPQHQDPATPNIYRMREVGGQLTFTFDQELRAQGVENTPSVHTGVRRVLFSMLFFASVRPLGAVPLSGSFTEADMFKLWDIQRPGRKQGEDLRKYFLSIATGGFSFDNKKRGKERVRYGFNFCNGWTIKGSGGPDTRYSYVLSPFTLGGITEAWIKGELSPEIAKEYGGYVPYPAEYLQQPLKPYLDNIRAVLLTHRWGRGIRGDTFMKRWARVEQDLLKRPDKAVLQMHDLIKELEKEKLIGGYKITYASNVKPLRKGRTYPPLKDIKLKFEKPKREGKRAAPRLTEKQKARRAEILEWLTRERVDIEKNSTTGESKTVRTGANIHGTRTPPAKIEEQLDAIIRRHGFKKVSASYEKHAKHPPYSPVPFWEELAPRAARGKGKKH